MISADRAAFLDGLAERLEEGTASPADVASAAAIVRHYRLIHSGEGLVRSNNIQAGLFRLFGPGILKN